MLPSPPMTFRHSLAAALGLTSTPAAVPAGSLEVASPFANDTQLGKLVLSDLFGTNADSLPVTRAVAMTVPAVARARNTLAPLVGRLPLRTYRGDALMPASPLDVPETAPARSRQATMTWTMDSMLFYGRAWWVVSQRYADTGRPASFRWVPEWDARIEGGQLVGTVAGEDFAPRDVVRIDGPHEGILNFGAETIRQAQRLDSAANRIADNPVPAIELHQTTPDSMTDDEIDKMIETWQLARRKSGVAYTSSAVETKIHGLNPEQLIVEGRKFSALQIARMLGVPAWVVDAEVGGSSLTYSNVPSRSRELVDYSLTPYLSAIEGRLSMDDILPRGQWCRFDLDELLRADFGDRMNAYKVAIESKVYTVDELRAREAGTPAEQEN